MATPAARKSIKDVFYETRVLMGRDYTVRRFATEVLGSTIDPVMLGYIEKGKRFPSEVLVRRLAAIRKEDPHELLALLWRDRILYAFGKELRRVLQAPRAVAGIEDADLAVVASQAIAALPDDGSWIPATRWREQFRAGPRRRAQKTVVSEALAKQVEETLRARELIELRSGKVRRRGRHFVAQDTAERQALALEFCALFAKGLLDKLALADTDTGTYLRNHYLNIDPARLVEFQKRLDAAVRQLAQEFASDASSQTRFLNVLVTSTPF
ncbi:MAG TPA: hypothetical protein VMW56_14420 [Candidatus Margulisiibacteriota bacterium]|nr:hypothetical protein [Candidatus Margulisiibacteriota bacterium]